MTGAELGTAADAGEFGLIAAVLAATAAAAPAGGLDAARVPVGPGDDAALLALGGPQVLVSTDMLVEGRHFRRDWSSAADIGTRAAAANLADIAAMGGLPRALLLGFGGPADVSVAWARDLGAGLAAEAATVGAVVIGGDTVAAPQVVLAITVLGEPGPGGVVTRSGARPGDVVAMFGRLGWAAAGLAVLRRGFRSPRAAVAALRSPEPPYAQGPAAALAGARAMIDVSDGLLADLGHIARASSVGIDVDPTLLPVDDPVAAVGAALNADPLDFVLTGGDDHALVACFPTEVDLPTGWRRIGRVTVPPEGADAAWVTVAGARRHGSLGHDHFGR
jgi:thiamine-monophosphate kinase